LTKEESEGAVRGAVGLAPTKKRKKIDLLCHHRGTKTLQIGKTQDKKGKIET